MSNECHHKIFWMDRCYDCLKEKYDLAHRERDRYQEATEKGADTFNDLSMALAILGKPLLADVCAAAERGMRAALEGKL